ncbi:MAG: hypothetical protein IPH88_16385 [Bacteroidales bacterium]|nr:hypothetical protein [Bacteroidales bacterium]
MDDLSIDLLWQLVKEYPYFQTARLLLAKNLDMAGHEAYPLSLRLAAAYAGDRRLLKKLMDTRTTMALVDGKIEVEGVDGEVRGSEFGVQGSDVDGKIEVVGVDGEVRGSEFGVQGSDVNGKIEVVGVDGEVQGSEFGVQGSDVDGKIEVDGVDGEVQGSEFEVQGSEFEVEELKVDEIEVEGKVEEIVEGKVEEIIEKKIEEKVEEKFEEKAGALSPLVGLIRSSLTEIGQERIQDPAGSDLARSGKRMDPKERNALIEKFITEEPRISAPKKEFFNPLDHARQSSVEHDDLVTETLARIFEQQGHTLKAIKIYEKLVLLIPEKSNYFAARIVELRQLLK